jgi:hypothetical protein
VSTFADRGVSPGQRDGSPAVVNISFLDRGTHTKQAKLLSFLETRRREVSVTEHSLCVSRSTDYPIMTVRGNYPDIKTKPTP